VGFQARKSFKVMPGVRMTVSKSGISTSVGVAGARLTRGPSGRVTRTVGLPGTGIRHTETLSRTAPTSGRSDTAEAPPATAKPGLTSPRWEKELYAAITGGNLADLPRIAQAHPEAQLVAATVDGLMAMQAGESQRALGILRWVWSLGGAVETHPFVVKYLSLGQITMGIATGVSATLPLCRDAVGLALAELEQKTGQLQAAVQVIEQLDPSVIAAVSLCELYLQLGWLDNVIQVSNGLRNVDDPTALLITFRALAFQAQGHETAAQECFKEALKSNARDAGIRHLALIERAKGHIRQGNPVRAKKDLERVLAENAANEEVRDLLDTL